MSFAELSYEMIFIVELVLHTHTHTYMYICKTLQKHTYIHAFNIDQSIQPVVRKEKKMLLKVPGRFNVIMNIGNNFAIQIM